MDTQRFKIAPILVAIILLAAVFRLVHLGTNPPAIFRDEAEKGYTAFTIAKTGGYFFFSDLSEKPQLNFQRLPIFINVLGVYTSAIYQYCAVPFVAIGGLNEWTVRLTSALVGIATVFFVFLLVSRVADSITALWSAFLLAISPWHIIFSRWALQGIFVPLLTVVAVYFFLRALQTSSQPQQKIKKVCYFLLSSIFFTLNFYAYEISRVFIPLFLLVLLVIYRREIKSNLLVVLPGVIVFLFFAVLILQFYLQPAHQARFQRISIFSAGFSTVHVLTQFLKNYLSHYSPAFLFLRGDAELRHSIAGMGELHLFSAPLLLYGLWIIITRNNGFHRLLLGWFFIFPVAASLTREGIPHSLRSICALPMPDIICAIAINNLISSLQQKYSGAVSIRSRRLIIKIVFYLGVVLITISILIFAINLFAFYPYYSAINWQYGVKEALSYLREQGIPPEKIYLSGYITYAPYLIMFYEKIPPTILKREGLAGLRYNFLPPGASVNRLWSQLPADSYLILYPGELFDIKPYHIIPLPSRVKTGLRAPALLIFHK